MYKANNQYRIYTHSTSAVYNLVNIDTDIIPSIASFVDGVNKIN